MFNLIGLYRAGYDLQEKLDDLIISDLLIEESDEVAIDIQSTVKDAENIDVAVRLY